MRGINSAGGMLGFAGAQEGDGGEVRPVHGDGSVHPPGRAMPLAASSASPCSWLGDDGTGKRGFVQPPPGQAWPRRDRHRVGSGGFCTPCILASRQRFWCGLRDMVAALKEGAALFTGVSGPSAMPRESVQGFAGALGLWIRRRAMLAELRPRHGAGMLPSPLEARAGAVWSSPHPLEWHTG